MKKLRLIPVLALVFLLNVASMCSNDDNNSSFLDPTPIINAATQGTWRITLFDDSGNNETAHFTGYNFTFGTNTIIATNGTNTYNGTWSVTNDGSNDDNPGGDLDFNIHFSSPPDFTELNEDWHIISVTATKIQLIHVSGGNGGTDYLTFEKN